MSDRPSALVLAALLLAGAGGAQAQLDVADLADRMQAALGAGFDAGDVELLGRLDLGGSTYELRIELRRDPFAWREELTLIEDPGAGAVPLPEGLPRDAVYVSNGARAWHLTDELGPSGPMPGMAAVALLDRAHLFRLLLDPRAALLDERLSNPSRMVTEQAAWEGVEEEVVFVALPHATAWLTHVDRASGRLTALLDSTGATRRWYELSAWRDLGGGLVLPTQVDEGIGEMEAAGVLHLVSARTGLRHADDRFPDDPALPLPEVADVSPLILTQHPVPGGGLVVLPGVEVHGGARGAADVWTIVDTGATDCSIHLGLAEQLRLPAIGGQRAAGAAGAGVISMCWLDRAELEQHALLQLPVGAVLLPPFNEVPSESTPGLLLGGRRLMQLSPVLDFAGKRFLARGDPSRTGAVRPLAEIAGRPTLTLPLGEDRGRPLVEVSVGGAPVTALLDTGMATVLRIARADLSRLGLPEDEAAWLASGAVPYRMSGVHGHERDELLVRLDRDVQLGPVTLRRPFVTLMSRDLGGAGSGSEARTIVGLGAFTAFEQVGFDWGRRRLELLAPAEFLVEEGDAASPVLRAVIPEPGLFVGMVLNAPDAGATERPGNLPVVVAVVPGTPAERAGLREGDRLAAIGELPCDGRAPMDLWDDLRARAEAGVELLVLRGAGAEELRIWLEG